MEFDYLHHSLGLYILLEYGISNRHIELLKSEEFVLNDFMENTNKTEKFQKAKRALSAKINEALQVITKEQFDQSLYKLVANGLSIKYIQLLKDNELNYPDLRGLDFIDFIKLKGFKSKDAAYRKIMEAYQETEKQLLKEQALPNKFKSELESYISSLPPKKLISLVELKSKLIHDKHLKLEEIDDEDIKSVLSQMVVDGIAYETNMGFGKKFISLKELLSIEFKNKETLIERLEGKTLQEIAGMTGVTRERVRQKIGKTLQKMPLLEEYYIYKTVFETYNWNEPIFCKVFEVSKKVYNYLLLTLSKGSKTILEALDENLLNDNEKEKMLKELNYYRNSFGEFVPYSNKSAFFEELVFNLAQKAVHMSEFIEIANEDIEKKGLNANLLFDERNVIGLADRSLKVLRTRNLGFRYYDISNVDSADYQRLCKLLDLEAGIYSTSKLYNENPELMDSLNLDSEHELHNLLKKSVVLSHIEYTRMPEFAVGGITKREFLIKLFNELAPITITEFVEYVNSNYGLKSTSLTSLLLMEYIEFIHGDTIIVNHYESSAEELKLLDSLLDKDIFTIEEFVKKGIHIDKNFHDKYVNNSTLLKLNYFIRGSYILNRKYNSIDQYFVEHITSQKIFRNTRTPIYQNSSFNGVIYNLEKELDIIRIDTDLYITLSRLEEVGVNKSDLIGFREAALSFVAENTFFSLPYLRKLGFKHELEELGFDDLFYERIIWSSPMIKSIHTSLHISFNKTQKDIKLNDFIRSLVIEEGKLDVYVLEEKIHENYEIGLKRQKIIDVVRNSDLYYSDDTEYVYLTREQYYADIYRGR